MWLPSWLRARKRPATPRPRPTFRPQLEALEGRVVPSTLTVTNTLGYAADGSLRTEIALAQKGDTIVFSPDLFIQGPQTIGLSNPPGAFGGDVELFISKDLTIQGPGAGELAISGGAAARVFEIAPGAQVAISGLTIKGGNGRTGAYDPAPNDGLGGGILNYGTLTVSGCIVSGNFAGPYGYGSEGGGLYNAGTMTLTSCTVTGNSATFGGGIYNAANAHLALLYSTVTGNSAHDGTDVFNGGKLTKSHSTIGH